ncbi:hypothetical protein BJY16_004839 [Actinoplanes octamycinicus]|uniref:Uncharacterized protein n=1 Tax=Actinoplanes octamycinicus TaxID=135948 RepID=A0A7W7GZU0_9ACTN|nr:hypothetical protein [Actinoplanes octamycinicus]MBB4741380.1 hypothetical protein [Actinoplanes octamycinicus]
MLGRSARRRRWAAACGAFVAGELALRLYWLAGGRWAYTACDRTHLTDPSGGCGADRVGVLPFWPGWGSVAVGAALAVLVAVAFRRPGRSVAAGSWAAAVLLLVAAFPLHLLFEIPAALAGRPADWRDLGARLALAVGGALFATLASAAGPPREPLTPGYRPVPRWTRRWAYAAVALPVVGWAVPHGLWLLDVPFGVSGPKLAEIHDGMSSMAGLAITLVPPLAGLLVLGLVQRWGQEFPGWLPFLGGRPVPRLLAIVPAAVVAAALITYGLLSSALFTADLLAGKVTWPEIRAGWAVTATLLVFTAWGATLAVTTAGYALTTRPRERPDTRDPMATASLR